MTFKLNNIWREVLARLPESSMGAQHVDLILSTGAVIQNVAVFNGEEGEVEENFDPETIIEIRIHRG